jgi:hypothetical protein
MEAGQDMVLVLGRRVVDNVVVDMEGIHQHSLDVTQYIHMEDIWESPI